MDRWIFLIKVNNGPGVLATISAVFADRGVSLDCVTTYDIHAPAEHAGLATLTFRARPSKKEHLARLLRRLEPVRELTEYHCDDDRAHKAAFVVIALALQPLRELLEPGIRCDLIMQTGIETTVLLMGSPSLLDETLLTLSTQGLLRTMMLVAQ